MGYSISPNSNKEVNPNYIPPASKMAECIDIPEEYIPLLSAPLGAYFAKVLCKGILKYAKEQEMENGHDI